MPRGRPAPAPARRRHPEPEGRRRQDHRHAGPGLGGRRGRPPRCWSSTSTRRRRRPGCSATTPADGAGRGRRPGRRRPRRGDRHVAVVDASTSCPAARTRRRRSIGDGTTRLRAALAALPADRYEAILVDCPPTLGGPTLSALTAARHALIVVDPSALGLRGIGSVADAVDGVWEGANPDLDLCGVVVNRVPAISAEAERRHRRARPHRRAQHDLEAARPAAGDRQPGPRRAPPDPRLRQPGRRRRPRLRRPLDQAPRVLR